MTSRALRHLAIISGVALCSLTNAHAQGALTGTVNFDGAAPKMKTIKMDAEQTCKMTHGDTKVKEERVVVNADGKTLKNVFVYIKNPPPGAAAATGDVSIEQKGCQYFPHVFGIRPGQTFKIVNSDSNVLHNIHAFGQLPGNSFNMGQPGNGTVLEQKFGKPEMAVHLKCDVHGWMSAWVNVVDHPYFAVSDDKGAFSIANVPAGDYDVEAWQEELGTQDAKVKVDAKGGTATFTFKPAPPK